MRTKGRGIFLLLIIAIVSLLLASCGNKGRTSTDSGTASAAPAKRSLPPLPNRPLSPELRAMRDRAMRESSVLRGLGFKGEVGMTELSGWDYGRRTTEAAEFLGGEDMRAMGRLAAAGGMLPEGTDLAALAGSFTAISAAATYSPLDKQVLLVDRNADRYLLTHEFTHALQDQHFDLMKLLVVRPYDFDRTEALFAVVEGDALSVQRRAEEGEAYERKSLEEIAKQERERFNFYRKEVRELFPALLIETFSFRYRDGLRFVEEVRRKRGMGAINELFARPPLSSEQILHTEKYFQQERPREVLLDEGSFNQSGWRLVTSTPLGEIGVRGLLMSGASERDATRAAAGWGGDRAFLFEKAGGSALFVWKTVWDKTTDAEEFFRTYNGMQKAREGATLSDSLAQGETEQSIWREAGRLVIIRREGDSVIIIRGLESDAPAALELARR